MNPRTTHCLVLVLSGGLFNCFSAPVYPVSTAPDSIFGIVVKPAKTQVLVRESFSVALRVENLTTTNQVVHTASQSWQVQWQTSNPDMSLMYPMATANIPITINIPPGGAYTNELSMCVVKPVTTNKLSFQMGFTPGVNVGKTYWSKEVTIDVFP
jgi:hypothetical protein